MCACIDKFTDLLKTVNYPSNENQARKYAITLLVSWCHFKQKLEF